LLAENKNIKCVALGGSMSLSEGLKSIDPRHFDQTARKQASEHNYSDVDLNTKCLARRKQYPIYDLICKKIENDGKPLLEETLINVIGMEQMLRALIEIGEENEN
jgi:hypothetical protein